MGAANRVALLFVDGFGWGRDDPSVNPGWSYGGTLLRLPPLSSTTRPAANQAAVDVSAGSSAIADATFTGAPIRLDNGAWAVPLDACLGVPGLPQSATGQTTLLTGINAAAVQGRHLSGFPGPTLRALLLEHSLLLQLRRAGRRPVFFNTYRTPFFSLTRARQLCMSATTVANLAADLPFFDVPDMAAGRSLYQDFTGEELRRLGFAAPLLTPAEAGACLARNLPRYDFLLYEYFRTDRAGHTADRAAAEDELRRLDAFLEAILAELPPDTLLMWCSDHGNLEDLTVATHTRNPVPLLAWGPGAREFMTGLTGLDQVAPAILRVLG
ncbi:MAG: alkaline phosphatase family protein [Candidatus Krumholzibacteria bacterium]|nr:alkaline phosphatase family protein [Candidatus Krumholzibacteria bacterium]